MEDDLSLLRLVDPGPYPCAILDESVTAQRGDWILKLGHPGGYVKSRPPVARLGRVLDNTVQLFISDCQVAGGDSGGPFFDLNGQLIGILNTFVSDLKNDRDRPIAVASNSLIISKMDSIGSA